MSADYIDLTSYLTLGERRSVLPDQPGFKLLGEAYRSDPFARPRYQPPELPDDRERMFDALASLRWSPEGARIREIVAKADVVLMSVPALRGGRIGACTVSNRAKSIGKRKVNPCLVLVEADLSDVDLESSILHELTHVGHEMRAGGRGNDPSLDIRDHVLSGMVMEADAPTSEVIHAYQTRSIAPERWEKFADDTVDVEKGGVMRAPLCRALEKSVAGGESETSNATRRAIFAAWMTQTLYPNDYQDSLMRALQPDTVKMKQHRFRRPASLPVASLPDYVRAKDGTSYLDGVDFNDPYLVGAWATPKGSPHDESALEKMAQELETWREAGCQLQICLSTLKALSTDELLATRGKRTFADMNVQFIENGAIKSMLGEAADRINPGEGQIPEVLCQRFANDFAALAPQHPVLAVQLLDIKAHTDAVLARNEASAPASSAVPPRPGASVPRP